VGAHRVPALVEKNFLNTDLTYYLDMPRVLRIINRFNLGGPTYNVAYLTKYLEPDFETLLVGGAKDDTEDSSEFILEQMGIKPVIIPEMKRAIHPLNDRAAYRKIKEIIREFKPDIVHTHASKAGTLGRLAAAACKVPAVVHTFHGHVFHSYFGTVTTAVYKSIERYLATKTDCIIAISEKQKQELTEIHGICSPGKVEVIPLGFDLQRFQDNMAEKRKSFRSTYNIDDDEIAVVIIGRLVPVKNHELFLKALSNVKQRTSKKVRAFIVGDGEERASIESMARGLGLDFTAAAGEKATLTFTSWIKDVDRVCAGADMIALTSHNEGTPVSLIEAQAANRPVVTTDVGGIRNVILEGTTGLLSPAGNLESFSSNLLMLIENDDMRLEMGSRGWEHVKAKFSYMRLVSDVKQLYLRLLDQKKP
jgi:glycosyltransferase involved in cell wall biosynthesis